jgi:hypothetical protein
MKLTDDTKSLLSLNEEYEIPPQHADIKLHLLFHPRWKEAFLIQSNPNISKQGVEFKKISSNNEN